ncbi:glycosyltransferase family 4 protein [Rubripirellula sp.]|nr:glycosyltransferase family 4 protein [Rubripirellula sp.]
MHEFSDQLLFSPIRFLSFKKILKQHAIDLVYVMDFIHWKPIELITARKLGIPTICFCDFYKPEVFKKSFLKHCNAITTNSNATAARIAGGVFRSKTHVIYNSIDTTATEWNQGSKDGPPTIGFLGSLIPIKGIEDLLNALPEVLVHHPDLQLLLAGSERDNDGYESVLRNLVKEMNLTNSVRFLGHVDDIQDFFSKIDLLVVPSHDEPFGYINIEAGRCGIPVIGTRVGGIPEIIEDEKTGLLIAPHSPNQISGACKHLLANSDRRRRMGLAAKKRIESTFAHSVQMPKWTHLIEEVSTASN